MLHVLWFCNEILYAGLFLPSLGKVCSGMVKRKIFPVSNSPTDDMGKGCKNKMGANICLNTDSMLQTNEKTR